MSHPEDKALFEQGVDIWSDAIEHRLYGDGPRRSSRYVADLSGAQLGLSAQQRMDPDSGISLNHLVSYPRAEFGFCDLRGTDFRTIAFGFDFRSANFSMANLRDADLTAADLSGAKFVATDLQGAVLRGAKLENARLDEADLTGTDLSAASPWTAQIFKPEPQSAKLTKPANTTVTCVADLLSICSDLIQGIDETEVPRLYYRGEPRNWKLRPSVVRNRNLRRQEGKLLSDLITHRPKDFEYATHAVDQWVMARHHGLKTRLLDITTNPLVALFFACNGSQEDKEHDGRFIIFGVPTQLIRPYDSDSISVVANFTKLSFEEQNTLLGKRRHVTYDHKSAMGKLYHLIGEEKPHFHPRIDPRDLFRIYVLEPKRSFERLSAQSGAFLISAFHDRFERDRASRMNRLSGGPS